MATDEKQLTISFTREETVVIDRHNHVWDILSFGRFMESQPRDVITSVLSLELRHCAAIFEEVQSNKCPSPGKSIRLLVARETVLKLGDLLSSFLKLVDEGTSEGIPDALESCLYRQAKDYGSCAALWSLMAQFTTEARVLYGR